MGGLGAAEKETNEEDGEDSHGQAFQKQIDTSIYKVVV